MQMLSITQGAMGVEWYEKEDRKKHVGRDGVRIKKKNNSLDSLQETGN